jgi:hypothetical protein
MKSPKKYNVRPELLSALIQAESGFNPAAISPKGARGIAQVMPATARNPGYGVAPMQNNSSSEQIRFANDYLGAMLNKYGGNEAMALAAYNAGPGAVDRAGGIPQNRETRGYLQKIAGLLNPISTASADETPYQPEKVMSFEEWDRQQSQQQAQQPAQPAPQSAQQSEPVLSFEEWDRQQQGQVAGSQAPKDESLAWSDVPGQALRNIPSSAMKMAEGTYNVIRHPLDTADSLLDAAEGGIQNLAGESGTQFMLEHGLSEEDNRKAANAIADFYKQRYGGAENLKQTIATDPLGVMMDASAVLGGAGALTGAKSLTKAGQAINPVGIGAKVVKGLGKGARDRLIAQQEAMRALRVANAERDAALAAGQAAGYVTSPGAIPESGVVGRLLGGISGKAKTDQAASIRNLEITDKLVRKSLGFDPEEAITKASLAAKRQTVFEAGYQPVRQSGTVVADAKYLQALDDIAAQHKGAAGAFPGANVPDVKSFIEPLKAAQFDAGGAVDMVQVLRDKASAAYRTGDTAIGKAAKSAANALEDQLGRHLEATGASPEVISNFRNARTEMAKLHSVEKALDKSGRVSAVKLGKSPYLTGDLKVAAEFGRKFGKSNQMVDTGFSNPYSVLDFGMGGAGSLVHGPAGLAWMLARPSARSIVLNPALNKLFTAPSYNTFPGLESVSGLLNNVPVDVAAQYGPGLGMLSIIPAPISRQ